MPPTLLHLLGADPLSQKNVLREAGRDLNHFEFFPLSASGPLSGQPAENLSTEQLRVANEILASRSNLHALHSPAGAGKSYILAALLGHWALKSAPADMALFVTARRRHRHSALQKLRDCLSPECVWILDGLSETDPATDTHLSQAAAHFVWQALRQAHEALLDLDHRISALAFADEELLFLHTLRLRILFVDILWREGACREDFYKEVKVVVATADLTRKAFQTATPHWARDRRLQVLVHDEVENSTFIEFLALAGRFATVVAAGDKEQRIEQARDNSEQHMQLRLPQMFPSSLFFSSAFLHSHPCLSSPRPFSDPRGHDARASRRAAASWRSRRPARPLSCYIWAAARAPPQP